MGNGILVPQHDLELLLGQHCDRLGAEVRRGVEVHGVRGDLGADADVVVETSAGDFPAGWVVAADGGRSVLRKQLGIEFAGTEPQMVGYQAIADFDDPGELSRGWTWTPRGVYTYGPIPGRILVARFGPQPQDRNAPVSLEELQRVVREVTGTPVTLTGLHGRATRWSDNARQARSCWSTAPPTAGWPPRCATWTTGSPMSRTRPPARGSRACWCARTASSPGPQSRALARPVAPGSDWRPRSPAGPEYLTKVAYIS